MKYTNIMQRVTRAGHASRHRIITRGIFGTLCALFAVAFITHSSAAAIQYQTLFTTETPATAAANDSSAVELGVKFTASSNGSIAAVKFYKGTGNTGTHVGKLWTSAGQLLAQANFKNETATGWQTAKFSSPVPIYSGEVYVASYYAPAGHYAVTPNFFTQPFNHLLLTAPADATGNPNGVFMYGTGGGFPTQGSQATNYWVDVKYTTSNGPPAPPPAPYVQPGTQGYKGAASALTTYSAANGLLPAPNCAWQPTKQLRCEGTDLSLDHVYIKGGIYWTGCGSLNISSSVVDWKPSTNFSNIQATCTVPDAGATIMVTNSTLRTGPGAPPYNVVGQDIAPLIHNGTRPLTVKNSLMQGFPQGISPGTGSVIQDNEIYISDNICPEAGNPNALCHSDGIFNQGGDNVTMQGNYIVATDASTAAVFIQGEGSYNDTGNKVIGNYLSGGSHNFTNETGGGVVVKDNTFTNSLNGEATDFGPDSCGSISVWTGNIHPNGFPVPEPAPCVVNP